MPTMDIEQGKRQVDVGDCGLSPRPKGKAIEPKGQAIDRPLQRMETENVDDSNQKPKCKSQSESSSVSDTIEQRQRDLLAAQTLAFTPPLPDPIPEEPQQRRTRAYPGAFAQPGSFGARSASNDQDANVRNTPGTNSEENPNAALVEATPLSENAQEESSVVAVNEDQITEQRTQRQRMEKSRRQRDACAGIALVAVFLAIVLAVVVTRDSETIMQLENSKRLPTSAPSTNPSLSPSGAPSSAFASFYDNLPQYTLISLQNVSSPQSQAMNWVLDYPNFTSLEGWRQRQLFALACFHYSFSGNKWIDLIRNDWLLTEKHECYWYNALFGIITEKGEVLTVSNTSEIPSPCNQLGELVTLAVSDLRLAGENPVIPPELSFLTSLTELHLFFNDITTSIQAMIPTQLYSMTQLKVINLLANSMSGTLSTEFGLISDLEWLALDFNFFVSGTVPSELGQLTKLTRLSLSLNSFYGTIPSELGGMTSLVQLDLDQISLSGFIPTELGRLSDLTGLSLNNNLLTAKIPTELGQMTQLFWSCNLNSNSLTGAIPSEFGWLSNLTTLNLQENSLSGPLPSELGLLSNMTGFRGHDNMFAGLPSELGLLESLENLDLASNSLSSTVPSEVGMLARLESLKLTGNSLVGPIPSQLGLMSNLTTMDLSTNLLEGGVPSELGLLTSLQVLDISNLPLLTGSLPNDVKTDTLSWLNVSGSGGLYGVIPEDMCQLNNAECNYTLSTNSRPTACNMDFDCGKLCGCECPCS